MNNTTDFSFSFITTPFKENSIDCQEQINNMFGNVYSFCGSFNNYFFLLALTLVTINLLFFFLHTDEWFHKIFTNYPNELIAFNIGISLMMILYLLLLKGVI